VLRNTIFEPGNGVESMREFLYALRREVLRNGLEVTEVNISFGVRCFGTAEGEVPLLFLFSGQHLVRREVLRNTHTRAVPRPR